ncbi:hypothetical protein ACIQWI_24375 [Peribacillus frigoritolerans]
MPSGKPIPCAIYKDNKKIGTFDSAAQATNYLEETIEGYLYEGVQALLKGWVPPKNSQLYGYSAKHILRDDRA